MVITTTNCNKGSKDKDLTELLKDDLNSLKNFFKVQESYSM